MIALLSRTRRDIKWGLVIHTVLMFSCATIYTVGGIYPGSISYINNRGFPGTSRLPPGPFGYQYLIGADPFGSLCFFVIYLNQWLADGLLVSSLSQSVVRVLNAAALSAIPMLCCFFHELLVPRLTMFDVPRLCGYVFDGLKPT